jgi:hypothetical protein
MKLLLQVLHLLTEGGHFGPQRSKLALVGVLLVLDQRNYCLGAGAVCCEDLLAWNPSLA